MDIILLSCGGPIRYLLDQSRWNHRENVLTAGVGGGVEAGVEEAPLVLFLDITEIHGGEIP